jgi:hypothetical protein
MNRVCPYPSGGRLVNCLGWLLTAIDSWQVVRGVLSLLVDRESRKRAKRCIKDILLANLFT